ncbi:MAG: DUF3500 domain-containing protein [Rhodospirillaceae bacterium]|nr:DUF3500 domain-containing protein [Rhodospirillaceae bacterium]
MKLWTEFGLRNRNRPTLSAREQVTELPAGLSSRVEARRQLLAAPLEGVRAGDGLRRGLYPLHATGVSTRPMLDAALALLDALDADQRSRLCFPIDADEWRTWLNIHINVFRHGIMLEDLPQATRNLAIGLMRATLSARGFQQARDIMRINGFLAELTKRPDEFGEWPYFLSFFGQPSAEEPWGWQLDGHHLNLNCVIIGDQMVMAPAFMGSEPCHIDEGALAGTRVFAQEERAGLDMIRSLEEGQAAQAVLRPSIHPDDLPEDMQHPFDGRMVGGAFKDNARIDYEGIRGSDLSDAQRRLLVSLVSTYVGWSAEGHAGVKMQEVQEYLDETCFSWMGATGDGGPFYYRVHSPVALIEFDHHPGVVFDNKVPSPHHVHSLIRAPNGGDYGVDLLRQHHERFDHSHGDHRPHKH